MWLIRDREKKRGRKEGEKDLKKKIKKIWYESSQGKAERIRVGPEVFLDDDEDDTAAVHKR